MAIKDSAVLKYTILRFHIKYHASTFGEDDRWRVVLYLYLEISKYSQRDSPILMNSAGFYAFLLHV